jgi:general secretion pathway protein E
MNSQTPISEFVGKLVRATVLSEMTGRRLLAAAETTSHPFDAIVTELGVMREDVLARALAEHFSCAFVEQPVGTVAKDLALQFGIDFLGSNALVPISSRDGEIQIVLADPFDKAAKAMVDFAVGSEFDIAIATRSSINLAIGTLQIADTATLEHGDTINDLVSDADLERLKEFARQEPVVRFVSRILQTAYDSNATDIHIEPFEHDVRVRMRIDGDLRPAENAPVSFLPGIVTRIKILAGLDISERRLPQDGRMVATVRGQELDLRVAISPAIHGETIVLRVLDRSNVALDLSALGFDEPARNQLRSFAQMPNGIFLITGPTGSGKTTTLYALLAEMNAESVKIFTVEDPVEYRLHGITQLQTNSATGLTFAKALRSILRHDPDVILIGEIRDRETAEIAVQAALTGHLVFATLHTNSALGAVTRLRDMGIDNYLIGATLKGALAQRLVRKSCACRQTTNLVSSCQICGGLGYHGRTVTHEIATIDQNATRMINQNWSETDLLAQFLEQGFETLGNHVRRLAAGGVTSEEEAMRVSLSIGGSL